MLKAKTKDIEERLFHVISQEPTPKGGTNILCIIQWVANGKAYPPRIEKRYVNLYEKGGKTSYYFSKHLGLNPDDIEKLSEQKAEIKIIFDAISENIDQPNMPYNSLKDIANKTKPIVGDPVPQETALVQ